MPATTVGNWSLILQGIACQYDSGNRGRSDTATSQEMQAASITWKRQGKNCPLELPEGIQPD